MVRDTVLRIRLNLVEVLAVQALAVADDITPCAVVRALLRQAAIARQLWPMQDAAVPASTARVQPGPGGSNGHDG